MGIYQNKRIVVTGPRDIHLEDKPIVYRTMTKALKDHPHSVTIGGARGVDAAAFYACAKIKRGGMPDLRDFYLELILPGHLSDLPQEMKEILEGSHLIQDYSVHSPGALDRSAPRVLIIELGMDVSAPQSYMCRNDVMLGRAGWGSTDGVLQAFPGIGKHGGGTAHAMNRAREVGMKVVETPVRVIK